MTTAGWLYQRPSPDRQAESIPPRTGAACFLLAMALLVWPVAAFGLQEREVYRNTKAGTALIVAIDDRTGSVSFGSGFFVEANGLLLTNAHVIEGHTRLLVYMGDAIFEAPEVLVVDPDTDVAALRVPAEVHPLPLAADMPDDGVAVIAVGYPRITDILQMGLTLHPTVFPINVSGVALGRSRTENRPVSFIQTTGPMNSGSSGGPLVRLATGEVVGMVVHTVPYIGQAKNLKGAVVGNVMLRAGINYSIPASNIRNWLASHQSALSLSQGRSPGGVGRQAIETAQTAMPVTDPFFSTAHLLHAMARVMKDDDDLLELAVTHYKASTENTMHADPCSKRARTELGMIFLETKKWQEAITEFSRASQCPPQSPLVSYHWGLALEHEGRSQDALKIWETYLVADTSGLPSHEKEIVEKIREKVTVMKRSEDPEIPTVSSPVTSTTHSSASASNSPQ